MQYEYFFPFTKLHCGDPLSASQTAAWLTETTSVSEEFGANLSEPFALKSLLLHHRQLGTLSAGKLNLKCYLLIKIKVWQCFFLSYLNM